MKFVPLILAISNFLVAQAFVFTPHSITGKCNRWTLSPLQEIIEGEGLNAPIFDIGSGGVRLAQESAVKITGNVIKSKDGSPEAQIMELSRYTDITEVKDGDSLLSKFGASIVCTGRGLELYKDVGNSKKEKEIIFSPTAAVRDALAVVKATDQAEKVVINFLGGDDLQVLEVVEAIEEFVSKLDAKSSTKLCFNSISHSSSPAIEVALTVISFDKESESEGLSGLEKAVSIGEVYFRDGKWFTVLDENINTAIE